MPYAAIHIEISFVHHRNHLHDVKGKEGLIVISAYLRMMILHSQTNFIDLRGVYKPTKHSCFKLLYSSIVLEANHNLQ